MIQLRGLRMVGEIRKVAEKIKIPKEVVETTTLALSKGEEIPRPLSVAGE